MKHPLLLPLTLGAFLPAFALASSGSATVILLRGNATLVGGKELQLKDEVAPGNTVKTAPRAFVKLLFKDNSQVNVGPDTTLKLEATAAGEPSLVNLVGGQIRAKVTKDLLQNGDSHQSPEKLLIQTKTAAMGIRGTDFSVSYNQQNGNTALITFEGRVAMTKLDQGESPSRALADNRNVQAVSAGQYSGAQPDMAQASVPVKISPAQLETLRQNDTYSGLGEKGTAKSEALASPVPPGVDPKQFASGAERSITTGPETKTETKGPPPEGFFDAKSGSYAPRAGGFIDLATGRYVPPPPGSNFDPNTGVYTPPRAMGQFDPKSGMYIPPKGVELDAVKGFVPDTKSPGAAPSADLSKLLNFAMRPDLAGQQSSFEKLFTPNAAGTAFMPPPNFRPPPPPGAPPPSPPNALPPPPKEPIDDPTCPYCRKDNLAPPPQTTNVNFSITVQ